MSKLLVLLSFLSAKTFLKFYDPEDERVSLRLFGVLRRKNVNRNDAPVILKISVGPTTGPPLKGRKMEINEIKNKRHALGISAQTLAKVAGLTSPYLSRIEKGHLVPAQKTISKIEAALDAITNGTNVCREQGRILAEIKIAEKSAKKIEEKIREIREGALLLEALEMEARAFRLRAEALKKRMEF